MITQKLFGSSMLVDSVTGMMQHGEIAIMFNSAGRSEIQVRNPETGDMEAIETGDQDSELIEHLVQAIRRVHAAIDLQGDDAPLEAS